MATNIVGPGLEDLPTVPGLQEALERLDSAGGELVLDFSAVERVGPAALRAMEQLAARAQEKSVRLVLRGVNVNVYKVLKLVKLAPRFSFLN